MATKKEREELDDEGLDDKELDDEELDDDEDLENYDDEEPDDDEDLDDEEFDDEDLEDDGALVGAEPEDDPYWWTPHLVLGLILLISLLGFFGFFNPWLGHLAPAPEQHPVEVGAAPAAQHSAEATPPPARTVKLPPKRAQEIYGARHILVQYAGARKAPADLKRTEEEAKKIAKGLVDDAKKTKDADNRAAAWKALAVEHDDPNAAKTGGDLGLFRPNAYDPAFVAAVKKMKVGEVSGPVETPFGYHIIWRTR